MAPEYAMEGLFSVKSDVFSFVFFCQRSLVEKGSINSIFQTVAKAVSYIAVPAEEKTPDHVNLCFSFFVFMLFPFVSSDG